MSYKHSFILRNQLKINIKIVLDIINRAYFSRRERGVGKGLILIESPFFQIQICLGFGTLSPQKGGCGGSILNFSGLKKTSSKGSNDDGKFFLYRKSSIPTFQFVHCKIVFFFGVYGFATLIFFLQFLLILKSSVQRQYLNPPPLSSEGAPLTPRQTINIFFIKVF